MTSNLKHTRSTPSGYSLPRYVCFDCDQATASTMLVARQTGYGDGSTMPVFVHRTGTGCHKGIDSRAIYADECHPKT